MKKLFLLIIFLFCLPIYSQVKPQSHLNFKILNTIVKDGEMITFQISNNSNIAYCFVIDTNYYSRDFYPNRINFKNPKIVLYDNDGNIRGMNVQIKDHISINDSIKKDTNETTFLSRKGDTLLIDEFKLYSDLYKNGFVSTLMIYTVKPKQSLKLRIPFNLVTKYLKDGVHEYYEIDNSKKYNARIEYMIKREYIEKYISKKTIESLENKGYKFFIGNLKSNNVPLKLKNN
ncbi:hypothetical protein OA88_19485 [Flavobacterium sp. JRM]|nr:hypothetical protein OA88_19485 [Flavobacterium sp. JRM]